MKRYFIILLFIAIRAASNETGKVAIVDHAGTAKKTGTVSRVSSRFVVPLSKSMPFSQALDNARAIPTASPMPMYSPAGYMPSPSDYDNDGISNDIDLDDDNDGILDAKESGSCFYALNDWNTLAKSTNYINVSSSLATTLGNFDGLLDNAGNTSAVTFSTSPAQPILNKDVYLFTLTKAVKLDALYLQFNTTTQFAGTTKLQGSHTNSGTDWVDLSGAMSQTPQASNTTANGSVWVINSIKYAVGINAAAYKYYRITGAVASDIVAQNASEVFFDINADTYQPNAYPKGNNCIDDTDGDGLPNHQDLDSDGDGCADALEGGGSFTTENLVNSVLPGGNSGPSYNGTSNMPATQNLGNTVDANGVPTIAGANGQTVRHSQDKWLNACADSDGDGVKDPSDFDDDNDGILDIVEGDCSGLRTQSALTSLSHARGLPTGRYYFNLGKTPFQADVDDTEGGGWVLVAQYVHKGGTDPALKVLRDGDNFPITSTAILGTDESIDANKWGHAGNAALSQFTGDFEIRFYGESNLHPRKIHFKTPLGTNYVKTGIGSFAGIKNVFTALKDHTSTLPSVTDSSQPNHGDNALTAFPFYKNGNVHWGIKASTSRWEVDDYANGSGYNTIHKVWIRAVTATKCELPDKDGDGIANRLDLDSDGDGCSDAIEGGANFNTSNLVTSTMPGGNSGSRYNGTSPSPVTKNLGSSSVDANGVPTLAGAAGQTLKYSQDKLADGCIDSDGDGIDNITDLDDDNDGILDNVEGDCTLGRSPEVPFNGLAQAKGIPKGRYYFKSGDKVFQADVDDAEGGGWVLVAQYVHLGGTNPDFKILSPGDNFPATSSSTLGTDESGSTTKWGHAGNAALNQFPDDFVEIRFYGETSAHSRKIHFSTHLGNSFIKTGKGSFDGIKTSFTTLTGHNANLPSATNTTLANLGDKALTEFPYYTNSLYHWSIKGGGIRWEVDDYPNDYSKSTIHRIWVRLIATPSSENASAPCTPPDADKDGIPNLLDLDSDGDGCADAIEGGGAFTNADLTNSAMSGGNSGTSYIGASNTSIIRNLSGTVDANGVLTKVGADGQTIQFSQNQSEGECGGDSDKDGIKDSLDIDRDNDGILNAVEAPACYYSLNEWNTGGKSEPYVKVSSELTTTQGDFNKLLDNVGTANAVTFSTSPAQFTQGKSVYLITFAKPVQLDALYLQFSTANSQFSNNTKMEGSSDGSEWIDLGTNVSSTPSSNTTANGNVVVDNSLKYKVNLSGAPYKYYRITGTSGAETINEKAASEMYFDINPASYRPSLFPKTTCNADTDGDYIHNQLDLDSDGDGCADAIEGGAAFTSANLTNSTMPGGNKGTSYNGTSSTAVTQNLTGTVNADGVPDIAGATGQTIEYSQDKKLNDCVDSDKDGINDIIDLDDDNDGITDEVETYCFITVVSKAGVKVSPAKIKYTYTGAIQNLVDGVDGASNIIYATDPSITPPASLNSASLLEVEFPVAKKLTHWEIGHYPGQKLFGVPPDQSISTYKIQGSNDNDIWNDVTGTLTYHNNLPSTSKGLSTNNSNIANITNTEVAYKYYRFYGISVTGGAGWATELYFKERICVDPDLDKDSIPNQLDLDSDGDGCADAIEGGADFIKTDLTNSAMPGGNRGTSYNGTSSTAITQNLTGGVDANGIPTKAGKGQTVQYSQEKVLNACADSDEDGQSDLQDIDDDNDGIVDTDEAADCYYKYTDWNVAAKPTIHLSISSELTTTLGNFNLLLDNVSNDNAVAFSTTPSQTIQGKNVYLFSFPKAVRLDALYLKLNTLTQFKGNTKLQGSNTNDGTDWTDLGSEVSSTVGTYTTVNGAVPLTTSIKYPVPGTSTTAYRYYRITGGATASDINAENASEVYFDMNVAEYRASLFPKANCMADVDGDGILNQLDLDSDGDGCSDAIEGGAAFTNTDLVTSNMPGGNSGSAYNGSSDTAVTKNLGKLSDANGLPTKSSGTAQTVKYSQNKALNDCTDSDGDGVKDIPDLDDDNDGILDVNEQKFCRDGTINFEFYDVAGSITTVEAIPTTGALASGTINTFNPNVIQGIYDPGDARMYGIRFAGDINITIPGEYTFYTNSDDGTKVYIDDNLIVDNDGVHATTEKSGTVTLAEGEHKMKVLYFQYEAAAWFTLSYMGPGIAKQEMPFGIFANCPREDKDTDGDGIPDRLDLDSDGDACSDAIEGGASFNSNNLVTSNMPGGNSGSKYTGSSSTQVKQNLGNTVNPNGVPTIAGAGQTVLYADKKKLNECTDTDADGQPDINDIDDDNDGILDAVEAPGCYTTLNEWNTGIKPSDYINVSTELVAILQNFGNLLDYQNVAPAVTFSTSPAQPIQNKSVYLFAFQKPVKLDALYLQFNDATSQFVNTTRLEGSNTNNGSDWKELSIPISNAQGSNTTKNGNVLATNSIKYPVTSNANTYKYYRITGAVASDITATHASEVYFDMNAASYQASQFSKDECTMDTDSDGIINPLDRDSDGDGCSDAKEAGATTDNTADYKFTGTDANNNGLVDSKETEATGKMNYESYYHEYAIYKWISKCADSDGDGVSDITDHDDDNDGITDINEAPSCYYASYDANMIEKVTSELTSPDDDQYDGDIQKLHDRNFSDVNFNFNFNPTQAINGASLFIMRYPTPVSLTSVTIASIKSFGTGVTARLQGSVDSLTWVDASSSTSLNTTSIKEFTVTNATAYRYYRILGDGGIANTDANTIIAEISSVLAGGYDMLAHPRKTCTVDTDGDGINDHLDLDSDGDGCADAIEGSGNFISTSLVSSAMHGGNSGTLYNGTSSNPIKQNLGNTVDPANGIPVSAGTGQAVYAAKVKEVSECIDTDNDGISDIADIDDDNDGVLDTIEGACLDGKTPESAFTSLSQARNVIKAGIYHFNISGVRFSTSVSASGYALVASDYGGSGTKALDTTSNLTHPNISKTQILPAAKLSVLTDIGQVRISHTGGKVDVNTNHPTLISRVKNNSTLYAGFPDNNLNDSWTGVGESIFTVDAAIASTATQFNLPHVIYNTANEPGGFNWLPAHGTRFITLDEGQIQSPEQFMLWVRGKTVASLCSGTTDTDKDGIPNRLDLDSDNDGCPDAKEAQTSSKDGVTTGSGTVKNGGGDTTSLVYSANNAVITNPVGTNGFADVLENTPDDGTYKTEYSYQPYTDAALVHTVATCTLTGGTASLSQTICTGTQPADLSLSGQTGAVTKWQYSPVSDFSTGVTDIASSASITLTSAQMGVLTATRHYRAEVRYSTIKPVVYSSVATITVTALPAGGTVSPAQTICSGTPPADLTLSGHTGNVLKWQRSTSTNFSGATDIAGTAGAAILSSTTMGNLTQTTYFKAIIKNEGCPEVQSGVVTITVTNDVSVGGTITTPQTSICTGTPPADLTLNGHSGNVAKWQRSTNTNFSGATDIAGAAGFAVLSGTAVGNLTQTTYFKAIVKKGTCAEAASGVLTVTVSPASVAGNISTTQTSICSGTQPGNLTLSGYAGSITKWQRSTNANFSGATDIAGAAGSAVVSGTTIGSLTQTTYFKAFAKSGACGEVESGVLTITVDAVSAGGTISGAQTICSGTQPANLSLSGHTGHVEKWQRSTNANFSGATDIASTAGATVLTNTAIGTLTQTTYLKTFVKSGTCGTVESGVVTITVDAVSAGGTISGAQTICSGMQPASLTLSGHTGSVEKWQRSANSNFSGATDIAGTAGATVLTNTAIGTLTQTTYLKTFVKSGTCGTVESSVVTITVDAVSVGGTISGAQTICSGMQPASLTLSGHTGSVEKWQRSANSNFSGATDIAGTAGATVLTNTTIGTLTQTTYFKTFVKNGTCGTVESGVVTITVDAASAGGTISGAQTICSGMQPASLTLSGHTGSVEKWQRSTNANFSGATDIAGTAGATVLTNTTIGTLTQTTYFKTFVKNGTCGTVESGVVTITVDAVSAGGTISGAQTICSGMQPASLTLSGHTGSVEKWQRSTNANFSGAADMAGTAGATVLTNTAIGTLTQTTYFKTFVKNGTCGTVESGVVTITVDAASAGGTISGAQTICSGMQPASLTLSGHTGHIEKWQRSTNANFSGATDIAGTAGATVLTNTTIGTLTQTTYYKAIVKSGSCGIIESGVVTITVDAASAGGTISGAQTICSGMQPASLTLSGYTGSVEKWQRSTNANFSGATDIAGTAGATVLTNTTIGTLTQTTYFKTFVKSGTCGTVESAVVTITIDAVSAGGTIAGAQTICSGMQPASLTLSSHTGHVEKWQRSTNANFSGATDIAGTAGATVLTNTTIGDLTQTTYFKAIVKSGACGVAESGVVTITVDAVSAGGTISGAQTICSGTQPASLSLSGHTGNVEKWQHSTVSDFSSGVTDMASSASATLTSTQMGGLTANRYYRAVVKNGVCAETSATPVLITVSATSVGGTVSGSHTICNSSSPSNSLSLSGYTGNVEKWQYSAVSDFSSGVTDMASSASATLTSNQMGTLTSDRYYRAVVKSGVCNPQYSSIAQISVRPAVAGGTITPANQTICSGNSPASFVLNGYTGDVVKWQYSDVSNFVNDANDILSSASATLPGNKMGTLTANRYYRAVVQVGSCPGTANSTIATVNINPLPTVTVTPAAPEITRGQSVTLTASGASSYTWSPASGLSATSGSSVSANPTTTTTYVVTGMSANNCPASVNVLVKVNVTFIVGAIAADQTICSGTIPNILTSKTNASGGTGTIKYQWQSSSNNTVFANIPSATQSTYEPGALTQTTYYRRGAYTDTDPVDYTNSVTIIVEESIGGTVNSPATVCSGTSSTLIVNGFKGDIVKWQSSSVSNFNSEVVDIANTSTTLKANNIVQTTYYRAIVKQGACPEKPSTVGIATVHALPIVTVSPTTVTITRGKSTTLTAGGATSYTWTSSDGVLTESPGDKKIVSPTNSTTYTVKGTDGNGCKSSATATVAVNPILTGGTIEANQTICSGNTPAPFTSASNAEGGTGTIKYQWESSADNLAFRNIAGATQATYGAGVLTRTTYYRRGAYTDNDDTVHTGSVAVMVEQSIGGSLSGSADACSGTNNTTLILSGQAGSVIRWESSPVSGFASGITPIAQTGTKLVVENLTATKYYRVIVKQGNCTGAASTESGIAVKSLPTVSVTPASPSMTIGGTVSLTASGTAGNTYNWSPPEGLSSTSGASVTANPATTSTYHVSATGTNGCISSTSVTVQVNGAVSPGSIAASQTICPGGTPAAFTSTENASGGTGTIIYQWQSSADGNSSNYTDIVGATQATYAPGALTQTTYYRRGAKTNEDKIVYTRAVNATIEKSEGGTVNASTSVCSGSNEVTLSSIGRTGSVIRWESSPKADFSSNVIAINNTTNSLQVTNLTATTHYRVVAQVGTCTPANSIPATITIIELPAVSVSPNKFTITPGSTATLTVSGNADSYLWTPSTALSRTTGSTVEASPSSTIEYTVTGTKTVGGCTNSAKVGVTVVTSLSPGAIASSDIICSGTKPEPFISTAVATGGSGTIQYQWEQRIEGGTYTHIAGATSETYSAPVLTQTTYYRRKAYSSSDAAVYSNVVTVEIIPSKGGTANGATTICAGTNKTTLTVSGKTGNVIRWESSPTNSFSSGVTRIAHASNVGLVVENLTQTTYYRAVVQQSDCTPDNSSIVEITVNPLPVVSITPASAAISRGFAVDLTASGADTYLWTPSTSLSATNTATVTANPNSTISYTLKGTKTATNCSAQASVAITVNSPLVAGTIASDQQICSGNTPTTLLSSADASDGTGTKTYQWQKSIDNTSFDDIPGANAATYSPGTLSQATYYRRSVSTATDGTLRTNTVKIEILSAVGGTIGGTTTVCSGQGTTFALNGHTGNIIKWQSSTTSDFSSGVQDISNTTATLSVTNLAATTYYRAVVGVSTCTPVNSNIIAATVHPAVIVSVSPANATIQSGNSQALTASGADTYKWSPATGLSATTGSSVMASPTVSTSYTVIGTSSTGCTAQITVTVTVIAEGGAISGGGGVHDSGGAGGGSSAGNQAGCGSYTPDAMRSVSGASGVGTSASYQWESSTSANFSSGATEIAGATGADYTPTAAISVSTHYRRVTIYNGQRNYSNIISAIVHPALTVSVSPANATIQSGNSQALTASGADTYKWSPATGLSATTGSNVIASPTVSTSYTVIGTSSTGCTAQITVTVTVIAEGGAISGGGGVHDSGGAGGGSAGNQAGCGSYTPDAMRSVSGANGVGTSASYQWESSTSANFSSGATEIAGATGADYTPTAAISVSTHYRRVTIYSGQRNYSNIISAIVHPALTVSVSPANATIQSGNSQALTASGADTYKWSPATGLSATTGSNVIASPTVSTSYAVTGANTIGCTAKATVIIKVVNAGTIARVSKANDSGGSSGGGQTSVGKGAGCGSYMPDLMRSSASGTTDAGTTISYQWESSATENFSSSVTNIAGATGANYTPTTPVSVTTYYRRATIHNGQRYYSNIITAIVYPAVIVSVNPANATIQSGNSQIVTASGADTYTWSPATGLSATTGSNITASPTATTTYTVAGINIATGCKAEATFTIAVQVSSQDLNPGDVGILENGSGALVKTKSFCFPAINVPIHSTTAASGGVGNYQYVWQKSTDNSSYEDVVAEKDVNWTVRSLASGTWYIRRKVVSGNQVAYCPGVKVIVFSLIQKPVISANAPLVLSRNGSVVLSSTPATGYLWSDNSTSQNITVTKVGIYRVKVTDTNGCASEESEPVTVIPPPPVVIDSVYIVDNQDNPPNSGVQVTPAQGGTLRYYMQQSEGTLMLVPELPKSGGVFTYYVEQVINGIVSRRVPYTVTMRKPLDVADHHKLISDTAVIQSDGSVLIGFKFLLINKTDVRMDSISLIDELEKLLPTGTPFTIQQIRATGNLVVNTAYNGGSVTNLLMPQSWLAPEATDTVYLKMRVLSELTDPWANKSTMNGKTKYGRTSIGSSDFYNGNPPKDGNRYSTQTVMPSRIIQVPTGFSPNGDGINDKLVIKHPPNVTINLKIFNRWGNIVYSSPEYQNEWGGEGASQNNLIGTNLPEGTYFYIVVATNKMTGKITKYTDFLAIKK